MKIQLVDSTLPKTGRTNRYPQHSFTLRQRPWQIQPFLIAPVLPGDTLVNLNHTYRAVSCRLISPLVGWWSETYFFYVKHRDLTSVSDDLVQMHLDAAADVSAVREAVADGAMYHAANAMNYVELCLQRVVEEYFREEEDGAWNSKLIGNVPIACIGKNTGFESLRNDAASAVPQDEELPGEVSVLPYGVDSAWSSFYTQWENMRALGLTTATFEDYLAGFGVSTPEVIEREDRPELLRYFREWSYPTNTVEPTTGVPTTALSVSHAGRADKNRFFKEPGFIFGVQVFRPKVYFGKQKGAMAEFLDDAYAWLPPAVKDQTWTSLRKFAAGAGPLAGLAGAGNYWVDFRDLYIFGDQFANYDMAADVTGGAIALPDNTYQARYADGAMADALFVQEGKVHIACDGVTSLTIKSKFVGGNET